MSTERLSQLDADLGLGSVVDSTTALPEKDTLAHAYLIPCNDPARLAFDEIASRIKLDPAAVPPQCIDNMCISLTKNTIRTESDDDTDAEVPLRRERAARPDATSPLALASTPSSSGALQAIGDYWLGAAIEGGTYGLVSRGIHRDTGEVVAIKYGTYRKHAGSLQNEINILHYLNECAQTQKTESAKYVCTLIEVLHQPGLRISQVHLVLRPLADRDLLDLWVKQCDTTVRVRAFRQAVQGLDFVHQNGVIHRDLKPSNIVVCDSAPSRAVIVDFGCATRASKSRDHMAGTIGYLASEVMALKSWDSATDEERERYRPPRSYDSKVDIFALGVTGCQVLLGMQELWDTSSPTAYLQSYETMDKFQSSISPSLFELLKRMVDNASECRPTTTEILADSAWD